MFTTASYTVAKAWKQPKCLPTEQGINKVRCIHTLEHYSATAATWMQLEITMLNEVNQKEKDKSM